MPAFDLLLLVHRGRLELPGRWTCPAPVLGLGQPGGYETHDAAFRLAVGWIADEPTGHLAELGGDVHGGIERSQFLDLGRRDRERLPGIQGKGHDDVSGDNLRREDGGFRRLTARCLSAFLLIFL